MDKLFYQKIAVILFIVITFIVTISYSFYDYKNNKTTIIDHLKTNSPINNEDRFEYIDTSLIKEIKSIVNNYDIIFSVFTNIDNRTGKEIDGFHLNTISIIKDGEVLFESGPSSFFYTLERQDIREESINLPEDINKYFIRDINKNNIPDLILGTYSGGAHCCNDSYIIELSNPISNILNLSSFSSDIFFKDLNNDGIMEIVTSDGIFDYWHSGYSTSYRPDVILSLQNNRFKADPNFMKLPIPTDSELISKVEEFKNGGEIFGGDSSGTWNYVLDLIYSGNIESAIRYVDMVWNKEAENGDFKTKEEFWDELKNQIRESSYYDDLKSSFKF